MVAKLAPKGAWDCDNMVSSTPEFSVAKSMAADPALEDAPQDETGDTGADVV